MHIGKGTYLDGRRNRTNKLGKRDTKELREDDREQLKSGPAEPSRSMAKSNRVNHQDPIHDCADDRVGNFGQKLRDGKHLRGIEPAVRFTDECTWFKRLEFSVVSGR